MQKESAIVAFSGGEIVWLDQKVKAGEAVLSLPLSRLISKMVRVPPEADKLAVCTEALKAMSPFPDEPMTVTYEVVGEDEKGTVVIAAALPESAADDIASALDAAKLSVVKIDALAFGELRAVWNKFDASDGKRRLIKIKSADCISLFVLDGDRPVSLRAVWESADMKREELLSLLEAEDFGGAKPLHETIEAEATISEALQGIAARANDETTLNALPESWREVLNETRFKNRLIRQLAIAAGIWLVIMGVLFGVPVGYGFMTDHMKTLCKEHSRSYRAVSEKKAKYELVKRYSDHTRGALEIMLAVSTRLPDGITLSSWDFKRDEGLRIRGEADSRSVVLDFKDLMAKMVDEEDALIFESVELGEMSSRKDKQTFGIDLKYHAESEEGSGE